MTKILKKISVFGLGKLGACMAATLASKDFEVVGVDIDPAKVEAINQRRPPVEEPLLAEFLGKPGLRLRATTDPDAAAETDATCFIPPTPSLPDGRFDCQYLLRAMESAARGIARGHKRGHIFICNSTTSPGEMESVIRPALERCLGGSCGKDFGLAYNPEFIALGDVIRGLLEPDLVLVGESDQGTGDALEEMYRQFLDRPAPVQRMSLASAEIAKISVNAFVTMKISFTNQIRMICEGRPGADANAVLAALGKDRRIGAEYLKPGLSYGGPCFPRDNRLLAWTAQQTGAPADLALATDRLNEATKTRLLDHILKQVRPPGTIGILGMAYKPHTPLTEESAGLWLATELHRRGFSVCYHDPLAHPGNNPALLRFEKADSLEALARTSGLKAVVVACPYPEYRNFSPPSPAVHCGGWFGPPPIP